MKAATVLIACGLGIILLAIGASTDAFVVGGTIIGFGAIGVGISLAWDTRPSHLGVSDRTLARLHRTQDRSTDVRAPRTSDG